MEQGSDHFSIILKDKGEIPTKQQQRWSINGKDWIQFQIESTITTKMLNQDSIEKTYRCQTRNILEAAKNFSLKLPQERREDHQCHDRINNMKEK